MVFFEDRNLYKDRSCKVFHNLYTIFTNANQMNILYLFLDE